MIAAPALLQQLLDRLGSSSVRQRLFRGTFWSIVGTASSRLLALGAAICAARILGRSIYGELGIIQSTIGMLGTLAGFGLGTTASKFVAELRATNPVRAGRIIALSTVVSWVTSLALAAVVFIIAPWICTYTLRAPQLVGSIRLATPLLVVSGINGAQLGILTGFEAFKSIARINFQTGLLNFPLVVSGARFFGLTGVIVGLVLVQAIGCMLNRLAWRSETRGLGITVSFRSCLTELPIIWQFSIPAVLAHVLLSGVNWVAAAQLVRQPNGLAEMGAFNAANQWYSALLWLPFMINSVLLPMFSERLCSTSRAESLRVLSMSLKLNGLVLLPLLVVGCALSRFIMMCYGPAFVSAWPTLIVCLATATVLGFTLPVGQLVSASGQMWFQFFCNAGWAVLLLVANNNLLKWGSLGLASARLIAYFGLALVCIVYMAFFAAGAKRSGQETPVDMELPSEAGVGG